MGGIGLLTSIDFNYLYNEKVVALLSDKKRGRKPTQQNHLSLISFSVFGHCFRGPVKAQGYVDRT